MIILSCRNITREIRQPHLRLFPSPPIFLREKPWTYFGPGDEVHEGGIDDYTISSWQHYLFLSCKTTRGKKTWNYIQCCYQRLFTCPVDCCLWQSTNFCDSYDKATADWTKTQRYTKFTQVSSFRLQK